jgi:hypothetical protein
VEVVAVHCEAQLLPESFYILQRVNTRREYEEDRCSWTSLFVGLLKWNLPLFSVLGTKLLLNIETGCWRQKGKLVNIIIATRGHALI